MGPSNVRTENYENQVNPNLKIFQLQWGRPMLGRKTQSYQYQMVFHYVASMGPSNVRTENYSQKQASRAA